MTDLVNPSPFKVIYLEAAGNDAASATEIPALTSRQTVVLVVTDIEHTDPAPGVKLPVLDGDVGTGVEIYLVAAPSSQFLKVYDASDNFLFSLSVGGSSWLIRRLTIEPIDYPVGADVQSFVGNWGVFPTSLTNFGVLG